MKNKKSYGVFSSMDMKPKSALHLEGEHGEQAVEHPIGRKVKVVVHATKVSHTKNSDGTHSARYDVNKIENEDNEKTDAKTEGKAEKIAGKEYSKHQEQKAAY
jgi:hypothetical protein